MKIVDAKNNIPRSYDKSIHSSSGLSRGSSGARPMLPPTYYGQRDNGCPESEKMPIFKAFLSACPLSNLVGQRASG
jgi:hypothetical protein